MQLTRNEALDLIYDLPVELAHLMGRDKLTDLHDGWIREMVFGDGDVTLQAHRGSYKTTCLTVAHALLIICRPDYRIGFFRKTDMDVAEVIAADTRLLETDVMKTLSKAMHGAEVAVTKSTASELNTSLAIGVSGSSQLVGMGIGGSVTGKHYDVIFTDDIITPRDRVSAAERRRTSLFYQELQNIRNRGGRIVNTGTPWHKDDTFKLMPNIKRWTCYETGLMTKEEIQGVRDSMSPSLFAANYELKHIADEDAMFTSPQFFDRPELLHDGIGHVDASYGGEDGTAFTCIKCIDSVYYVYIRLYQKHVDDCLDDMLSICKQLRIGTIYCESNADKKYLAKKIEALGHPCKTYAEHTNKHIKISTHLKGSWQDVRFLDCQGYPLDSEALNQILDYTEHAAHDDMPDSVASAIRQLSGQAKMKGWKESP